MLTFPSLPSPADRSPGLKGRHNKAQGKCVSAVARRAKEEGNERSPGDPGPVDRRPEGAQEGRILKIRHSCGLSARHPVWAQQPRLVEAVQGPWPRLRFKKSPRERWFPWALISARAKRPRKRVNCGDGEAEAPDHRDPEDPSRQAREPQ